VTYGESRDRDNNRQQTETPQARRETADRPDETVCPHNDEPGGVGSTYDTSWRICFVHHVSLNPTFVAEALDINFVVVYVLCQLPRSLARGDSF